MSKEAMKLALNVLENNKQTHYYCEDTWYSCPQHEDGCANDFAGDECTCGADKANAEIEKAITALREALANEALDRMAENARELGLDYEPAQQEPVVMVLPPIVEPTTKSKPVYIMGSYVGTGEVSSVTFGGVSFAGNGTAGREADVKPTGKWIQAKDTVKGNT